MWLVRNIPTSKLGLRSSWNRVQCTLSTGQPCPSNHGLDNRSWLLSPSHYISVPWKSSHLMLLYQYLRSCYFVLFAFLSSLLFLLVNTTSKSVDVVVFSIPEYFQRTKLFSSSILHFPLNGEEPTVACLPTELIKLFGWLMFSLYDHHDASFDIVKLPPLQKCFVEVTERYVFKLPEKIKELAIHILVLIIKHFNKSFPVSSDFGKLLTLCHIFQREE